MLKKLMIIFGPNCEDEVILIKVDVLYTILNELEN